MGISRIFEIFDKTTITDVILIAFEKLTRTDLSFKMLPWFMYATEQNA